MSERELARIGASAPRRVLGVGSLVAMGAILLFVALTTPPVAVGWLLFLLAFGGGALWVAQWMWRVTAHELVLTEEGLFDDTGEVIARLDDIVRVERGVFAMKPSSGFALQLAKSGPRAWRPGLWWRFGRRVAVGGVTAGHQTRPVADILMLRVAQREKG